MLKQIHHCHVEGHVPAVLRIKALPTLRGFASLFSIAPTSPYIRIYSPMAVASEKLRPSMLMLIRVNVVF